MTWSDISRQGVWSDENNMVSVYKMNWGDINKQAISIKKQLIERDISITKIVAICRGGCILGTILSCDLGASIEYVTFQTRSGKRRQLSSFLKAVSKKNETILVIDDIIDSGKTINSLHDFIVTNRIEEEKNNRIIFSSGCCFNDSPAKLHVECIIGEVVSPEYSWIVFPYEEIST